MHKCKCNIQWELIKNSASVVLYFRAALQPVHQMRVPFTEEKIRCEGPSRRRRSDARALHGGLIGRTAAEVQRRSAPNPPAFQRWTQPSSPACKPTALCTSQHSVQKHPQLRLHQHAPHRPAVFMPRLTSDARAAPHTLIIESDHRLQVPV